MRHYRQEDHNDQITRFQREASKILGANSDDLTRAVVAHTQNLKGKNRITAIALTNLALQNLRRIYGEGK